MHNLFGPSGAIVFGLQAISTIEIGFDIMDGKGLQIIDKFAEVCINIAENTDDDETQIRVSGCPGN